MLRARGEAPWRGAVLVEKQGRVTGWQVELVEATIAPPPSANPPLGLLHVIALGLLSAFGIAITAEYLQLGLAYSKYPIVRPR